VFDIWPGIKALVDDIRRGWRHDGMRGVADEGWAALVLIAGTFVAVVSLVLVLVIWD
jgi:hypothetical protein